MIRYIALLVILITPLLAEETKESLQEQINELVDLKESIQKRYTSHLSEHQDIVRLEDNLKRDLQKLENLTLQPVSSPELGRAS